jgi:hypothetical protein
LNLQTLLRMNKLASLSIAFLVLINSNVNSQSSETTNSKVKFGAGIDLELSEYFPPPSIKLSIELLDALKFEPGFGFNKNNSESDSDEYSSDYKRYKFSFGGYWINRSSKVSPIIGIYLDYSRYSYNYRDTNGTRDESGYEFRYGPSIGIEYIISDHFSIGGDFLLLKKNEKYKFDDNFGNDETIASGVSTGSNLRFRFYF